MARRGTKRHFGICPLCQGQFVRTAQPGTHRALMLDMENNLKSSWPGTLRREFPGG